MSRTVFLTGGSSGIGTATTQALMKTGWRVIAPSHSELNLANLDEVIAFSSSSGLPVGDIDILVHVAGVWHEKDTVLADKSFASFTSEQIVGTMNVGLTSFMLLTNQFLAKGKLSHVVGISGTFESGGGWLPYYTSKRALEDFLLGLAQDNPKLAVYGISPADTATAAYKHFYPQYAESAQSPEAVADLVVSLLDGTSNFKSGDIIELRDGKQRPAFHS